MRIIVTGGHFSPAFALAQELIRQGHEVVIAGRKHVFEGDTAFSYEYLTSKKHNIPFWEVRTGRLQRKLTNQTIPSLFKIPQGLKDSGKMIKEFGPDAIVVFGGYISLPVAACGFLKKIPVIVHEQTQNAGLANKIIAKIAKKVCITFESSRKNFPSKKVVLTGNPIRKEIFEINQKIPISLDEKIIYVTGGSSGSHFINSLIGKTLKSLLEKYVVIHQTGNSKIFDDSQKLKKEREALPEKLRARYVLREFIDPEEIGWVLKNSSLVIARSGINIVLELLALKKVSLFIPFPYGQSKEQHENARLLSEVGLGEWVEQDGLDLGEFLQKVDRLISEREKLIKDAKIPKVFTPQATQRVIDVIKGVLTV